MVAAARSGLRYVVLDRPNPIGGRAYGPMMRPGFTSGVGCKAIVQQHGMIVGELARTSTASSWRRRPAARSRWTSSPARAGPPISWPATPSGPDPDYRWADRLNVAGLPGVQFREAYFQPAFNKFTGVLCAGVEVKVTDRRAFDPVRTGTAMLVEVQRYPSFAWRVDSGDHWIDGLTGSDRLRTMVDAGASTDDITDGITDDIVAAWSGELAAFEARRRPYLLYGRSH